MNRKWCLDPSFSTSYILNSDTVTIINPLDEDPFSSKNVNEYCQYQYGEVKLTGTKLCAGLVFQVVNSEQSYNIENDAMIVDYMSNNNNVVHGVIGYNYIEFQNNLTSLYNNTFG